MLFLYVRKLATGINIQRRLMLTSVNNVRDSGLPPKTFAHIQFLTEAIIASPETYNPTEFAAQRKSLLASLPLCQSELPPRRMSDSFEEVIIPLKSDIKLRDHYTTHLSGVRIGRLLEDMDTFAVYLVFKHILNPKQEGDVKSPFSIVTALVDKINVTKGIFPDRDIRMIGHVSWVGTSSAESSLCLYQKSDNGSAWIEVTRATFVLVARDPFNRGPGFVNPLIRETAEEEDIFQAGELRRNMRRKHADRSLFRSPPSTEETSIIHDLFMRTLDHNSLSFKVQVKPDNSVWMEDAKLKNLVICQPDNRNRFNKIFGGFIMRQAFELAWANAYVYSKMLPYIRHMDDILFDKPVEIGSLLYFNSQVCYTEGPYTQVSVSAEVLQPSTGKMYLTNVFQYTFITRSGIISNTQGSSEPVDCPPIIVPKTYHEAMMYINGRRQFLKATKTK